MCGIRERETTLRATQMLLEREIERLRDESSDPDEVRMRTDELEMVNEELVSAGIVTS